MELCRWMRWKGSHNTPADPEVLAAVFERNEVPYSCLKTCLNWGPDDQICAPELCTSARGCFEPSPKLRRVS